MYAVSTVTRCQPWLASPPAASLVPWARAAQLTMLLATTVAPASHEPAQLSARPISLGPGSKVRVRVSVRARVRIHGRDMDRPTSL